jgi:hypothetical protein
MLGIGLGLARLRKVIQQSTNWVLKLVDGVYRWDDTGVWDDNATWED